MFKPATVWSLALFAAISTSIACAADRTFNFTYSATLSGLPANTTVQVWLPVPPSNDDQIVETTKQEVPATPRFGVDPKFSNRIMHLESLPKSDGTLTFSTTYRVTRHEVGESSASKNLDDRLFLKPDKLVPIGGKPQTLLVGKTLPSDQFQLGHMLYDVVDDHMQYRKDKPGWGRGDACWAVDSGFGNCTDFHSLFISLARTRGLPSIFEIGFSIPAKAKSGEVIGYHCWAKFKPADRGWVPVDISEANRDPARREYYFGHLDANRVQFSTGRDITLVPPQKGPPINFFVYPYAEVAGAPVPSDSIRVQCSYEDVDGEKEKM